MIYGMLSGSLITLAVIVALLFFRAFRSTKDRLFSIFAVAFLVLAAQQMLIAITRHENVFDPLGYAPRILAFGLILFAIAERNRR